MLELETQLDNLNVISMGNGKYRKWQKGDAVEGTLLAIDQLRKKYVRIMTTVNASNKCRDDSGDITDPQKHERAQFKTIIKRFGNQISA